MAQIGEAVIPVIVEADLMEPCLWSAIQSEIEAAAIDQLYADLLTELRHGPGIWLH